MSTLTAYCIIIALGSAAALGISLLWGATDLIFGWQTLTEGRFLTLFMACPVLVFLAAWRFERKLRRDPELVRALYARIGERAKS